MSSYSKGDSVEWNWGNGTGTGKIVETFTSDVTRTIKGNEVTLTIPDLAPTWGMSIQCKLKGANGEEFQRLIHNSIYKLKD